MSSPDGNKEVPSSSKYLEHSAVVHNTQVKNYTSSATVSVEPSSSTTSCSNTKTTCCQCHGVASLYQNVMVLCWLSVASYIGVVCRIYLTELSQLDGVPLFSSLYSQVVGTAIMGFFTSHLLLLSHKHPHLYMSITTGLCGSITSFSSWNMEAMDSLLQTTPTSNASMAFGWMTTLLLCLGMASGALAVGKHLATLTPWCDLRNQQLAEGSISTHSPKTLPYLRCVLCVAVWLGVSVLAVAVSAVVGKWDLVFSIALAPLGTCCRWLMAKLNPLFHHKFKLGTFIANIIATWLLGGVVLLQRKYPEGDWEHYILVGVATGFCGCLSTVSTFVVELSTLSIKNSYLYGFTSILTAQLGLLLIRGPVQWTNS